MNVYFDTEFTGLHKDTTLISLGMVADNGSKFYAEFNDFDSKQLNDWIINNVINNNSFHNKDLKDMIRDDPHCTYVNGDTKAVRKALKKWLSDFNMSIQLVSDVCHFDFVLFISIFGSAFDLPGFISPYCHDISQDIANFLHISDKEAFDLSRENFVETYAGSMHWKCKHNSLYDAVVIKTIYDIIH